MKLADFNEKRAEQGLTLLHPTKGFRPMTRLAARQRALAAKAKHDKLMAKLNAGWKRHQRWG